MKLNDFVKFIFILLSFVLAIFLLFYYFEYKITKKEIYNDRVKSFNSKISNVTKNINNNILQINNIIDYLISLDSFKMMDKQKLSENIQTIINSHTNILEILIFNKDKKFEKDDYSDLLSKLNNNKSLVTKIDLEKYNKDIIYPLIHILKVAKRVDNYIILFKIDINDLINLSKSFTYVLDKNYNIIYDKSNKYTWSKYYYPNMDMKNKFDFFQNGYIQKIVNIDRDNYLIFLDKSDDISVKQFFDTYFDEIILLTIQVFLVLFILILILIAFFSTINKKAKKEREDSHNMVKKMAIQLDENLKIIENHVMFLHLNDQFIIEDVSLCFCKMYGYQKEELWGQHYSILYSKQSYLQIKKDVLDNLTKLKEWKGEVLGKKKNGQEHWMKSYIKANYEEGKLVSYTIIRKDISDNKKLKKLYENLYYQMEQQNVIFQNVHSGITLIDLKGNIKKTNLAFCNMLGYNNDELSFINIFDLVDKRNKELLEKIFDELIELGSITNMEFIFTTKNGSEIYLNLSLKILPDKSNVVVVYNSLEDKRKLQKLNQNLEQRVKEEVRKNILKDKEHQEEKLKNVKLTSIGTLAAGITHEINTPITYLKGNFEMLQMDISEVKDENLKGEMLENCTKINDAINRISVIVESMREMSQSSSEIKEKTNIFSTLITSLTMAYNVSKQISRIYIDKEEFKLTNIKKDQKTFFAKIQRQRIEQVWIIIINNAIDELKKVDNYDNRRLDIDIFEKDEYIVVKFTDNAGGIKPEILPNIFEPFTSSKKYGGMGIGLNIAKKIIDEQNGFIKAYNEKNKAVFEIKFQKCE